MRVAALVLLAGIGLLAAGAVAYSLPFLGSALWYPFAPFLLVAALAVLVCVAVLALAVVSYAHAREEMPDQGG